MICHSFPENNISQLLLYRHLKEFSFAIELLAVNMLLCVLIT